MTDKAERLHKLTTAIREAAISYRPSGSNWSAIPLWQSINHIAIELGYSSYSDFNEQFLDFCTSLRSEISILPLKKEAVRQSWVACVAKIQQVFNAENFQNPTKQVINSHFSETNLNILDSISERLQTDGILESSDEQLKDALSAVEKLVSEMAKSKNLDERFINIFHHYSSHLNQLYSNFEIFGDDKFWKIYKEMFATFVQVHSKIMECDNAPEIFEKFKGVVFNLASKSVAGVSLLANAATVAQYYITNG